jgi:hypothetical protein
LIDTGALHANYVNEETARAFKALGAVPIDSNVKVCRAFKGKCNSASEKLSLFVTITNENTKEMETMFLDFTVIETEYDMIIGRPTIMAHNLVYKLPSQFTLAPMSLPSIRLVPPACKPSLGPRKAGNHRERIQTLASIRRREHMSQFIDKIEDAAGIPFKDEESPWQRAADDTEPESELPTKVYGKSAEIQNTIKLLTKYKHIFSTELKAEPANIPPMEIPVDVEMWEAARANKLPPRPQSILKQKETVRQIEIMKKT